VPLSKDTYVFVKHIFYSTDFNELCLVQAMCIRNSEVPRWKEMVVQILKLINVPMLHKYVRNK